MSYYLTLGLALLVYVTLWYVVSLIKKRNDVADIAWGLGFVVLSWIALGLTADATLRGILTNVLISIWGMRLATHIYLRNRGKGEDYRYQAWREQWGSWFYLRSYTQVYLLQGALLYVIALPTLMSHASATATFGAIDVVGVLIWCIGFLFETIGDAQLTRFIQNPLNKGKLLQTGLWAYTRHPNYFGEVLGWWGVWLLSLSATHNWLTIIGPLTITFLILKVSGIPLLEQNMAENPEFEEYKKRVSVFIPLPPKQ